MTSAAAPSSSAWDADSRRGLAARLGSLARDAPGRWSFAVAEGGELVAEVDADLLQPAASTIKVPLMIALLREVDAGSCALDNTIVVPSSRVGGSGVLRGLESVREVLIAEALELMVTVSDNTATNMIIDHLGWDTIADGLRAMGLVRTRLNRHMMDTAAIAAGKENQTTAGELSLLFDRLCTTDMLLPSSRETALDVLGRQQFNDRMPAYLDEDVQCFHKPGELPGRRHDTGVLHFAGRWVAFTALSHDLSGTDSLSRGSGPAAEVIGAATRAVHDIARQASGDAPAEHQ